ncbi:phospholipase D-like domain-containing protein [Psychrobacter jeotgali]|uniref:phospholipase D-like domain-containing protein n=1 Tax=Psychrobacter jeotgali TaxID=179010 RepID=UPI0019186EE6|nr:phospholipase D-like domain-containing protein [Psychrobacter jeotgali]
MLLDIFLTIHFILLLLVSLRVLARNNLTSPARLAWLVVLFILPYLGLLVYWMFGEIHLGRNFEREYKKIIEKLHSHNPEVLGSDAALAAIKPEYQAAFAYSANVTGYHTTLGNRAELMADAAETQKRMIADFDAATDHIHVLYYIWLIDGMGIDTAQALMRAAKRGVTCRAMVDGMGSRKLVRSKLWKEMEAAGVEVSVALPIRNIIKVMLFSRIDLRNHRKITVIDGKIGYFGSRNCADPEFRVKPKYAPWVDIMMRMEGPVVAQNQMLFASDWLTKNPETPFDSFPYFTGPAKALKADTHPNELINSEQLKLEELKLEKSKLEGFAAQIFVDGPTQRQGTTPQFLGALISQAQHTLIISTPYFVPDYSLISVLCATAYRGVEVTMIFPKHNDSLIVAATSHSYYWQLLKAGIKVYEYKPGLLHAKTLTVDGEISLIGSSNLDLRSFDLNYENNVVFSDKALSSKIIERQYQYIADSDEIQLEDVEDWPLAYRVWNNVVATMGPVL